MRPIHSLNPEQQEAFRKAAIAHSKERAVEFPQAVAKVDELLRKIYPPQLLSVVANYGLQGFVTAKGIVRPKLSKREFSQHHVELFQALASRIPRAEWGQEIITSRSVEPAMDALIDAADAFAIQRLALLETADTPAKEMLLRVQERLRAHTQVVRNWGSFQQVVDMSTRLYSGLDAKFEQAMGVSATTLIQLFAHLVRRVETLSTQRSTMLAKVLKKTFDRDRMIEKYYEINPHFDGTPGEFIASLPPEATRDNVVALIFSHSDLKLESFYEFNAAEAAAWVAIDEACAERALQLLTVHPEELKDRPVDHFFLDNPVWSKPLMPSASGKYFTATPQAFFSHIHRIFALISTAKGFETALSERRSKFLEYELHQRVSRTLPHAKVISNVKWRSGNHEFETDTVALIDRSLLIFEAKSGAISDPALRGAPDSAKRHVRELIEEPSRQSERFQTLVETAQKGDEHAQATLRDLGLWPLEVNRIVRTTITLEDFSVLSSAEDDLKRVAWIGADINLAPAMTLADLEVVGDVLENEASLTHYLHERMRLQKRFNVMADELDWLGFYLKTAFAFAATEKTSLSGLVLTGLSQPVDDYYNAKEQGVETPKPRLAMTRFWSQMLAEIAKRRFPGWIDASIALLRAASPDEQHKVERAFRKVVKGVVKGWRKPGRNNACLIRPGYDDPIVVVLFAYPSLSLNEQRAEAQIFAQKVFATSDTKVVLAIGFNANSPDQPFEYLAFIGRTEA